MTVIRCICVGAAVGVTLGLVGTALVLMYGGDTILSW